MKNIDKIIGSIIGGAVGDALGYPIEFVYSFNAIQKKYGEKGIVNYDLEYTWLDDKVNDAQVSDFHRFLPSLSRCANCKEGSRQSK